MWHTETGQVVRRADAPFQPVWSVAFRTGGGKLLVGCRDRAAQFYSIMDGGILGKPLDHEGNVANVALAQTAGLP